MKIVPDYWNNNISSQGQSNLIFNEQRVKFGAVNRVLETWGCHGSLFNIDWLIPTKSRYIIIVVVLVSAKR